MLVYQRVSTRTRMQWVLNSYVLAPYNWGCCRPRKIHHGFTKHRMRLWISRSLRSTQPCTTQTYLGSWAETGMIPEKPGRLTTSKKQPPKWVDFYIIQSYPIISNPWTKGFPTGCMVCHSYISYPVNNWEISTDGKKDVSEPQQKASASEKGESNYVCYVCWVSNWF